MSDRFVVTVGKDGSIRVETLGPTGPSCLEKLEKIQALLPGAEVVDSRLTDDYYLKARSSVEERQQSREEA